MKKITNALMGSSLRVIMLLCFGILFAFFIQNWSELTSPVEFTFITSIEHPLITWIVISFLLGICAHYMLGYSAKRKLKKTIKDSEKQNKEYLAELNKLRNLSLTDDIDSEQSVNPPESEE